MPPIEIVLSPAASTPALVLRLRDRERDGHLLHLAARVDPLPHGLGESDRATDPLLKALGDDPHQADGAIVACHRRLHDDLAGRAHRERPAGVLLAGWPRDIMIGYEDA